jgi:hypothetical protein
MRTTDTSRATCLRPALAASLVLVIALGTGGCGASLFADRVDLVRTSWRVTTVDDEPAAFPFTLSFNKDGRDGLVTVGTPCGPIELFFDWDPAADAIAFGGSYGELPCNRAAQATTSDFIDALVAVQSVDVRNQRHLSLEGPWRLDLARLP